VTQPFKLTKTLKKLFSIKPLDMAAQPDPNMIHLIWWSSPQCSQNKGLCPKNLLLLTTKTDNIHHQTRFHWNNFYFFKHQLLKQTIR